MKKQPSAQPTLPALRPCPFCGSRAQWNFHQETSHHNDLSQPVPTMIKLKGSYQVRCSRIKECKVRPSIGGTFSEHLKIDGSPDSLAAIWNTRETAEL